MFYESHTINPCYNYSPYDSHFDVHGVDWVLWGCNVIIVHGDHPSQPGYQHSSYKNKNIQSSRIIKSSKNRYLYFIWNIMVNSINRYMAKITCRVLFIPLSSTGWDSCLGFET